jgi:hypothetical protein
MHCAVELSSIDFMNRVRDVNRGIILNPREGKRTAINETTKYFSISVSWRAPERAYSKERFLDEYAAPTSRAMRQKHGSESLRFFHPFAPTPQGEKP